MFKTLGQLISKMSAPKSRRRQVATLPTAQMEQLEARTLPTTYLVLDYTPDHRAGSLADTFATVRNRNGSVPSFLDFNGDGRANSTDVTLAANQITARVQQLFNEVASGYDFRVSGGDVLSNTNLGQQRIAWGRQRSNDEVAVMYLGGTNRRGVIGNAPVAADGTNAEGSGATYTRGIALFELGTRSTPTDFVNDVAATAAHELGHMLGLRHPKENNESSNLMNSSTWIGERTNGPGKVGFRDKTIATDGGAKQNGAREVRASFGNQPQVYHTSDNGGQALMAAGHEIAGHEHLEGDEHESHHHEEWESFGLNDDGPQVTGHLEDEFVAINSDRSDSDRSIETDARNGNVMQSESAASAKLVDVIFVESVSPQTSGLFWETRVKLSSDDLPVTNPQHSLTSDADRSALLDTMESVLAGTTQFRRGGIA